MIVKFRRQIGIETKTEEYCQKLDILQESYGLCITLCFTTAFLVSLHTSPLHLEYENILPHRIRSNEKNGKSWFGLCPFHNDHNPSLSVNPLTNLWQCFGCGAGGGNVIWFVELFDQVDFKEAVNRLSACDAQAELSVNS